VKDREVGALDPALEDRQAEQRRHGRRQGDDHEQREGPTAEGLPPGRHRAVAVQQHEVRDGIRPGRLELEVEGHDVGAEAEEHALAEDEHAATPPGQADADRDHRVAAVLGEVAEAEVVQHCRSEDEQRDGQRRDADQVESGHGAEALHARLLVRTVNRPWGRICRKATTSTKVSTVARLPLV